MSNKNSYVSLAAVFLVTCGAVAGWSGYQFMKGVKADTFYTSETAELKSAALQALYISMRAATDATYTGELVAFKSQVTRSIERLQAGDASLGIDGLPDASANALASFKDAWGGIAPNIDKIAGSKTNTEVFTRYLQETVRNAASAQGLAQEAQSVVADHKSVITAAAQAQLQAAFSDLNEALNLINREGGATTENLRAAETAIGQYLGAMTAVGNTLPRDNTILEPLLKSFKAAQTTQRTLGRTIESSSNAVENLPYAGVIWQSRDRLLATINALSSSVAALPDTRPVTPLLVAISGLLTILVALAMCFGVIRTAASREKFVEEEGHTIQLSQRGRSQELKLFLGELGTVRDGNLNKPMTEDRESTKEIARELNSVLLSIKSIIDEAHNTIDGLAAATEQTEATARSLNINRQEQYDAINHVSDLMNHLLNFIGIIEQMMRKTQHVSEEVSIKVGSGSESVNVVHEGIILLNKHNTGIQHQSKHLIESFQHMGRISDVVSTVAQKAELVSYNAYLVAEQIEDPQVSRRINKSAEAMDTLSRESTEAVAEISQLLKTMTDAARDTQQVVDNSQREIESLITRSNAAQDALTGISILTEELNNSVAEVSGQTQDLKNKSSEVADTMGSIQHYANEHSAASDQTASVISDVNRQAQSLREVIAHFNK
jgi:methyl-accepting chemotaxis protein